MSRLWFVAQHEYKRHVLKRSFLLPLLSVPLVVAVLIGATIVTRALRDDSPKGVGYVDPSALLAGPLAEEGASQAAVRWLPFQTREAAQAALEADHIMAYYVLSAGYRESHLVELVYAQEPSREATRQIQEQLRVRLLDDQPPEVVQRVVGGNVLVVRSPDAGPGSAREFSGDPTLGQLLPALSGFVLVMLIFIGSAYLMGAVTDEKANRTIEILMTSIPPSQLMIGKILGIMGIIVTQLGVWIVLSGLLVTLGGTALGLEWLQDVRVDPPTLVLALVVLIPSYVLVAALMTALGASLADTQISQQVTGVLITFYLSLMLLVIPLLRRLNSPLMIGLSILPLTAPVVLPLRAAFALLPTWQTVTSVALQVLCAAGALWLAGRALRLGTLRYGRRLRWRELFGRTAEPSPPRPRRGLEDRDTWRDGRARRSAPSTTKALLILRHELVTTVTKPLFLLTCVGLPLLVFGQLALIYASAHDEPLLRNRAPRAGDTAVAAPTPRFEAQGYVDRSGLLQTLPDSIAAGTLISYGDETSARQALSEGKIAAYYVVPADYLASGELICVRADYSPMSANTFSDPIEWALLVNVLGGNQELAAQVMNPTTLQQIPWTPATKTGDENTAQTEEEKGLMRLIPMLVMLLLYGVVVMASGLLLSSVSAEKKNRVIEILLLSVSPRQMLSGKIIALGMAGLLQAVIWGGMGYALFALTGRTFNLPAGIKLSPSLLAWGLVFFLLGYALYASLVAGVGALVPDIKASRTASLIIYIPAFVGFEIGLLTAENPHGALSSAASLFPLTAPFVMIRRLVVGGVPTWQLLLSVGLTLVAIPFVVRAVARMFHAQNLLSGQPFSIKRFYRALLGRA